MQITTNDSFVNIGNQLQETKKKKKTSLINLAFYRYIYFELVLVFFFSIETLLFHKYETENKVSTLQ